MSQPVPNQASSSLVSTETPFCQCDWQFFGLVAGVILPALLVGSLIAYGFIVWFMQIFFFGPPSA